MADSCYSAATPYRMQLAGLIKSKMPMMFWIILAPPKNKFFSWLILQDRVWTTDRLLHRGWPNCGLWQLCKMVLETTANLMFRCRFTIRVWNSIYNWLGWQSMTPTWHDIHTVKQGWNPREGHPGYSRMAVSSLQMLVC